MNRELLRLSLPLFSLDLSSYIGYRPFMALNPAMWVSHALVGNWNIVEQGNIFIDQVWCFTFPLYHHTSQPARSWFGLQPHRIMSTHKIIWQIQSPAVWPGGGLSHLRESIINRNVTFKDYKYRRRLHNLTCYFLLSCFLSKQHWKYSQWTFHFFVLEMCFWPIKYCWTQIDVG